ncbi:hypothetical protein [Alicyclobacillus acidocaldarius]|uniref:hypothetical protein n=1 Tax=Alicyclobacillus acidocaldarius TaxID=405212 RepID=UPI0002D3991A|nr:hypothetical protein [Alicyclobacillus acidocaldarius]
MNAQDVFHHFSSDGRPHMVDVSENPSRPAWPWLKRTSACHGRRAMLLYITRLPKAT